MRLLTAGSLVRAQQGEPYKSKLFIVCSYFFEKFENICVMALLFAKSYAWFVLLGDKRFHDDSQAISTFYEVRFTPKFSEGVFFITL